MDIHISLVGRENLSAEIYRQIRQAILDGRLPAGARLPPTRELARQLSVSRTTVSVAYDRLTVGGYVATRVGAGTFVRDSMMRAETGNGRKSPGVLQPQRIWESIPLSNAFARDARYDFRSGMPDVSLFPHDVWRRLVGRQLRARAVGKGYYGDPAGYPPLRDAIARHIGVARGIEGVTGDDVVVTNGTQQALDVLARVLLAPGDRIAVEDPSYAPPRLLFRSLGIHVTGVPVDRDGLMVDALPEDARALYTTPSHQYPLGVALSLPRRLALLEWAERHNAAIIEDDYDSEFRFGGRPLEPLRTLDKNGRVVYVGSFSKTMLPTLRLGFIVTPPSLRDALHRAKFITDWHTPLHTQRALTEFIDGGDFARHIRRMNRVYQERHEIVLSILQHDFADHLDVMPSRAGLHIGAIARTLSAEPIAMVLRNASDAGVEVHGLARLGVERAGPAGMIIGYGSIPASDIPRGLAILHNCFDR